MLTYLLRRAAVQRVLLLSVLAVVAIGATLLGLCALLLTVTQERAIDEGVSRAQPSDVELTTFASGIGPGAATDVAADMRRTTTDSLAPFRAATAVRASTAMRRLDPGTSAPRRVAYLSGIEGLQERARLTAGRWPGTGGKDRLEAVVLQPTASRLHLSPGSRIRLGPEIPPARVGSPVRLTVVGVIQPLPDAGWDRDPLAAAGFDPAYFDGIALKGVNAYGPFVVPLPDLLAEGSTIDRLQVTGRPDLSAPTRSGLRRLEAGVAAADGRLARAVGPRVQSQRIGSDLPAVLSLARARQQATASTLLIVATIGTALTAAAVALAGRLVAGLRAEQAALLTSFGASRTQLGVVATVEALTLAAAAALIAVPLSSGAHAALTRLPVLADAGLTTAATVRLDQVLTVAAGAALLAAALVVPALRLNAAPARAERGQAGWLVRSRADVVLVILAVAGWWQLRVQDAAPGQQVRADVVRVLAPVLCLLAGAALALRIITGPLRAADWLARRSRGLVLPLAMFEAARRPRAVAAGLLLALAAAAATSGLVLGTTWDRSQHDQADARTGTDLSVALTGDATSEQGRDIAAVAGGAVSPVTDRSVVVGRFVGDGPDSGVRLVAVDALRAGKLLRGRLPDGGSWSRVGAGLVLPQPVSAVSTSASPLRLRGTSPAGAKLFVTPRLVLQDRWGLRTPCEQLSVPLDGRSHALQPCPSGSGQRLVAAALQIDVNPATPAAEFIVGPGRLTIRLDVPEARTTSAGGRAGPWATRVAGDDPQRVRDPTVALRTTPDGVAILTTSTVATDQFGGYAPPATLMVSGFPPPTAVPVAVSRNFAEQLGAGVGRRLAVALGQASVPVVVTDVVPAVPSVPGQLALLADGDALSRVLIGDGILEPVADAWWVGRPGLPSAAAKVRGLGLGTVVDRTEVAATLGRGPLSVGFPAALGVLIAAAILLVLAGTVMHVASDVEGRAVDVIRLRSLGLPRRRVLGTLLLEYGGLLGSLLAAGCLAGVVTAWAIGPLLIRSDVGGAPVPAVIVVWPWPVEAGLLAVMLVGVTLVAAASIVVQIGRADAAQLRVGS